MYPDLVYLALLLRPLALFLAVSRITGLLWQHLSHSCQSLAPTEEAPVLCIHNVLGCAGGTPHPGALF